MSDPDGGESEGEGGGDVGGGAEGAAAPDEVEGLPAYRGEGGKPAEKAGDEQETRFFAHGDAQAAPGEPDKQAAEDIGGECAGEVDRSPTGVVVGRGDDTGDGEPDAVSGERAEPAAEEDEEELEHRGSLGMGDGG